MDMKTLNRASELAQRAGELKTAIHALRSCNDQEWGIRCQGIEIDALLPDREHIRGLITNELSDELRRVTAEFERL